MRVAYAPLIAPYALNLGRNVVSFRSTDSNSHTSAFSRRRASEVCQSLAIPARGDGALGGARGVALGTPWRRINGPTSHGKVTVRAQGRRSASQRSTGHQAR